MSPDSQFPGDEEPLRHSGALGDGTFSLDAGWALVRRNEQRVGASSKFLNFTTFTMPEYEVGWFHEELARVLEKFLAEVIAGESPRLMISAPPRHGKSEKASRRFPAYAHGRYPHLEILLTSYAASLAEDMCEDVQGIIKSEEFAEAFPGLELRKANRKGYAIQGAKGKLNAAGVGGAITGKGAHILVIDDPIKNAEEASSDLMRDKVWDWYASTAYTRLAPGGGVLIIQTRWHEDDLSGRVKAKSDKAKEAKAKLASGKFKPDEELELEEAAEGDVFDEIIFEAIATRDEVFRKEGEALHPERYPTKALRKIRATLGSYYWSALYQQTPTPDEGDIFLRKWWRFYKEVPDLSRIWMFADTALKTKESSDYSVIQVWGRERGSKRIFLLDQWRDKVETPDLKRAAIAMWNKWKAKPMGPDTRAPSAFCIEDKASGTGLIAELKRGGHIPVREIPRHVDKLVRAREAQPSIEAGLVWLPDPEVYDAAFLSDYMDEFASFTAELTQKHDDQVDPTMDAIQRLILGNGSVYDGAVG